MSSDTAPRSLASSTLAPLKFIERRGYSLRVDAGGGLKGERRKGTDVTEAVRPAFA